MTRAELIEAAQNLKSDGTNPEYDRALVELVSDVSGGTFAEVAAEIGVENCAHVE